METKKCYLIVGSQGTGKSRKALEIVNGKKYIIVDGSNIGKQIQTSCFLFNEANKDTEYVIIDGITNKRL